MLKKIVRITVVALILTTVLGASASFPDHKEKIMNPREWIKRHFAAVFSTNDPDKLKRIFDEHFADDYVQYFDGKVLKGKKDFLAHRIAQSKILAGQPKFSF